MGRLIKSKLRTEGTTPSSVLSFNFGNQENINKLKETNQKIVNWLKRIGWLGFAFFLLKGLVWISVWLGVCSYFK